MSAWRPSLVLFDLDGVLVDYDRALRVRHLARACGCSEARAWQALFGSGLEQRFDAGAVSTQAYLDALAAGLGGPVDVDLWSAARAAAMQVHASTVALLHRVAVRTEVAVLTNNGRLLVEQLPRLLPALFPLLEGRVLCSAGLGACKPEPMAYRAAVDGLGHEPRATLFLDDSPANVEGAQRAGLRAVHVESPRALAAALAAYLPD